MSKRHRPRSRPDDSRSSAGPPMVQPPPMPPEAAIPPGPDDSSPATGPATPPAKSKPHEPSARELTAPTGGACLLRVFWMLLGNVILALTAFTTITGQRRFLNPYDAVFAVTLALMLLARWADITRFAGRTASGEPADRSHLRRYLILTPAIWLAVWLIAHAIRAAHD